MKSDDRLETLLAPQDLVDKAHELGRRIEEDYAGLDEPLMLVGVLKGCFVFLSDLCRSIKLPLEVEFISVSSYGSENGSSGSIRILKDLDNSITGRQVLIVEGIVDTGLTLHYLLSILRVRRPAGLKVCTMLDKPTRRTAEIPIDYRGFEIADAFVVGYGMDLHQRYRNLPYVGVLAS